MTSINEQQVLFVMLAYKYEGCLQGTVMYAHQQGRLNHVKNMGVIDKFCKEIIDWDGFMNLANPAAIAAILISTDEAYSKTANWLTKQAPKERRQ